MSDSIFERITRYESPYPFPRDFKIYQDLIYQVYRSFYVEFLKFDGSEFTKMAEYTNPQTPPNWGGDNRLALGGFYRILAGTGYAGPNTAVCLNSDGVSTLTYQTQTPAQGGDAYGAFYDPEYDHWHLGISDQARIATFDYDGTTATYLTQSPTLGTSGASQSVNGIMAKDTRGYYYAYKRFIGSPRTDIYALTYNGSTWTNRGAIISYNTPQDVGFAAMARDENDYLYLCDSAHNLYVYYYDGVAATLLYTHTFSNATDVPNAFVYRISYGQKYMYLTQGNNGAQHRLWIFSKYSPGAGVRTVHEEKTWYLPHQATDVDDIVYVSLTDGVKGYMDAYTIYTGPEYVVDTGAVYLDYGGAGEELIGATRGGTEFRVDQEYSVVIPDGCKGHLDAHYRPSDVKGVLTLSLVEPNVNAIQRMVPGSAVTAGSGYDEIARALTVALSDYAGSLSIVAENLGKTGPMVFTIDNPLAVSPAVFTLDDNEEPVYQMIFEAHFSPNDMDAEPWRVRYPRV